MFVGPLSESIVGRAQKNGAVQIDYINIRDFSSDSYHSVDDHPYGGGQGMILRVDIVDSAIANIKNQKSKNKNAKVKTILLDPQGAPYTQKKAQELSTLDHMILVCGHYEGVDERIRTIVDEEISIGDYIVSGGEIPAMVLVDSIVRLLPGVLKKINTTLDESFSQSAGLLEYPQYTRPKVYKSKKVPQVLLSGNHAKIQAWRHKTALQRTTRRRPDLVKKKL